MAGEMGAEPILCGFAGGENGPLVEMLLGRLAGERRLVATAGPSGAYVHDRRDGERRPIALEAAPPPSRHELDDLLSVTCAEALTSDLLVVCNAFPPDAVPLEAYAELVSDVRSNGVPVIVDLSAPRLDRALAAKPDLAKLNDWELAERIRAPVDPPERLLAAARGILADGAGAVLVTRGGEPALLLDGTRQPLWVVPPRFDRGMREGCGDSMTGAIAAAIAGGADLRAAVRLGAAAGAANFLRHGLGTGSRSVVESLVERVRLEPYPGV